jgi:hypothetical protein
MGNGAGEAMGKISMKGVLIGAIVDVTTSFLLGVPLAVYAMSKLDLTHTPKEQIGSTITAAIRGSLPLHVAELLVGLGCSVLGGYVAAQIAKRGELLNGALSSFLCLALGVYAIASGKDSNAHWLQVLRFVASPAFALLGGISEAQAESCPCCRARMRGAGGPALCWYNRCGGCPILRGFCEGWMEIRIA